MFVFVFCAFKLLLCSVIPYVKQKNLKNYLILFIKKIFFFSNISINYYLHRCKIGICSLIRILFYVRFKWNWFALMWMYSCNFEDLHSTQESNNIIQNNKKNYVWNCRLSIDVDKGRTITKLKVIIVAGGVVKKGVVGSF